MEAPIPALLAAQSAQREVIELERATDEAKRRLREHVRRAYIDGISLRSIAQTLGLSHQRVHQLVDTPPAGPRARWRRPERLREITCSFCGASGLPAHDVVAGAGAVICRVCVRRASDLLDEPAADTGLTIVEPAQAVRCSFCGAKGRLTIRGESGAGETVCDQCTAVCQEILHHVG